ncbi:MAG: hypothetical protein ACO2ZZ_12680 [Cyclobacteriaceae bacterium]
MPKSHKISTELLGEAMAKFNGNYKKTAEHFGVKDYYIRKRVSTDPKLRAIWIKNGTADPLPDAIEVMVREESAEDKQKRMLDALKKNGREVFQNDINTMLSNPDNIKKLDVFKEFDDSVGQLMAHALSVTQKINIRQNLSLFELSEQLKDELQDPMMDIEEKALKTRLLIQACEQQGKFHDRLLKGLEFQLRLYDQKEKSETKKKPGFRPLKELKEMNEKAEAQ